MIQQHSKITFLTLKILYLLLVVSLSISLNLHHNICMYADNLNFKLSGNSMDQIKILTYMRNYFPHNRILETVLHDAI